MPQSNPILAASAVIRDESSRILLIQRASRQTWVAGRTLPGGRVDPGETPEQAAIREAFEETGLTISIVRELGQLDVPDGKGGGL